MAEPDRDTTPAVSFYGWEHEKEHREEWLRCLVDVLDSEQWLSHGNPQVSTFEREFADWLGRDHAVAVSSGSEALALTFEALALPPGGEVITPALTFQATAAAVIRAGLTPRFVDVRPADLQLDPAAVTDAITPRTVAILPVHLYGLPAPVDELARLAEEFHIVMVEDCAQAVGARTRSGPVGTRGVAACFSCGPTKQLSGPAEGGVIALDDAALADTLRALRHNGAAASFRHEHLGRNAMMGALDAAFLRHRLGRLDRENTARRRIAERYAAVFADDPLISPVVPDQWAHASPSKATIRLPHTARDTVRTALEHAGIPTAVHYAVPLHRQPCFADLPPVSLPVTDEAARTVLSLPLHAGLGPSDVGRIGEEVKRAVKEAA
ncbi:DegT/DnrJ/EryC1/StrS family aminotransferase [Streptomyces lunalinharesii]|uniref:DegT/DnrJ/EryC1/StrS family aminotransferase n=1 Tax=Streptomyces lunalinharesii TaxID=333384 RepID=A0ABN3SKX1_9ACTN